MAETISRTKKTASATKPSAKPVAKKTTTKATETAVKKPGTAKTTVSKPTAKKPAVKKVAATPKPSPDKKPIAKKTVTRGVLEIESPKVMIVTDEQRYRMIAEAAYYRAEANNFRSDSVRDWIEAEKDIAALLSGTSR